MKKWSTELEKETSKTGRTILSHKAEVWHPALPEEHDGLSDSFFLRGTGFNLHQASRNNSVKYHKATKSSGAEPGPTLTPTGYREKESDN